MTTSHFLYLGFAVAAAAEMYFFLMQRVPLSVSRENGIDPRIARSMLPPWYGLVWLFKVAKWVSIVLIWQVFGWVMAVACIAIPFILSAVLPVPFSHFANILEKHLHRELVGGNPEVAGHLLAALKSSRSRNAF